MNLEYKHLLNPSFHPGSRVWVYQCSRLFSLSEAFEVEDMLNNFVAEWKSHAAVVKADAHLFFGQFIVLLADETQATVSGCSTDSSVRQVKDIEQKFSVNLFDRTSLALVVKNKIELLPLSQLQYALDNEFVSINSLYFNNLVQTKAELETQWIVPINESWLAKKIKANKNA